MPMSKRRSLMHRVGRAFVYQALLISVVAILSLYFTTVAIENVLIKKALDLEAEFFWREINAGNFYLSRTYNLSAYLQDVSPDIPENIESLGLGMHEVGGENRINLVYVTEDKGRKLYLIYNNKQVQQLVALYGLVPLACVLVLLYLSTWLAYRISSRAFSPVTWLAKKVNKLDPGHPDAAEFALEKLPADADAEIEVLTEAISAFAKRLQSFVERERNFTRDASHELRTPLTVISVTTDTLLLEEQLSGKSVEALQRIKRACSNVEELIQAFLMLAREGEVATETFSVNKLVEEEVEQAKFLVMDKPVEVKFESQFDMQLQASAKVVSVLIGNLLRNAVHYTEEGYVKATVANGSVFIEDSGAGIAEKELEQVFQPFFRGEKTKSNGFGVGLTIVKRILQQFGWSIKVDSKEGVGTKIEIIFPDASSKLLTKQA